VANPTLDFEHFLADRMSCTVDELRVRISQEEFMRWNVWHARRHARTTMRER
jgi:hypothetical protein